MLKLEDCRMIQCTTKQYHKSRLLDRYLADIIILDDKKLGTIIIKNRWGKCSTIPAKEYQRVLFGGKKA
jgi:hypothetical protein